MKKEILLTNLWISGTSENHEDITWLAFITRWWPLRSIGKTTHRNKQSHLTTLSDNGILRETFWSDNKSVANHTSTLSSYEIYHCNNALPSRRPQMSFFSNDEGTTSQVLPHRNLFDMLVDIIRKWKENLQSAPQGCAPPGRTTKGLQISPDACPFPLLPLARAASSLQPMCWWIVSLHSSSIFQRTVESLQQSKFVVLFSISLFEWGSNILLEWWHSALAWTAIAKIMDRMVMNCIAVTRVIKFGKKKVEMKLEIRMNEKEIRLHILFSGPVYISDTRHGFDFWEMACSFRFDRQSCRL